jgi:membrane-associated protease RseP (regulator of RpoE activity)
MQDVDGPLKGFGLSSRHDAGVAAVVASVLVLVAHACLAADPQPTSPPPAGFQPGDISIGEPIALPFAQPAATPPSGVQAAAPSASATAATPGWLGMSVAESAAPGRWTIVELVPAGPAAGAGIVMGDELRGVNGRPLASADDVSEAFTAITTGQRVRLSVARADRVSDVDVVALPRPVTAAGTATTTIAAATNAPPATAVTPTPGSSTSDRGWQSSAAPVGVAAVPAPNGVATVSVLTNPPLAAPATAPAGAASVSSAATPSARGRTALGVRTVPIDRGIQERFRLPQQSGAYVIGVVGDLPASKAGIPPGSVIVSLADRPVRSPQELTQLVAAGPTNRPLPLHYVLPGGTEKRADVVLQSLEQPLEHALIGEPTLQPSAAPVLEQNPEFRTSRRPESQGGGEAGELRREVSRLRMLLEGVEQRLERIGR